MPKFAVLDSNNTVSNVIVCDNLQIAEEATGLTCIQFPNKDFVTWIGDFYNGKTFVPDRNVI